MGAIERLGEAIEEALDRDVSATLSVLTGAFVGILVSLAESRGHNPALPITVDGGEQRDVTIHPPKLPATKPEGGA